jgi:hypothetical protein
LVTIVDPSAATGPAGVAVGGIGVKVEVGTGVAVGMGVAVTVKSATDEQARLAAVSRIRIKVKGCLMARILSPIKDGFLTLNR